MVAQLLMANLKNGIIYILCGEKFCRWGLRSVVSLKRNAPKCSKLPINVYFINEIIYQEQFESLGCSCILIDSPSDRSVRHSHRLTKSIVMQHNEFDRYVMIDADTYVQNNFDDIFNLIPESGIAGIEDGNFQSHLQMADLLFVKGKTPNTRELVKKSLNVDYGADEEFPPYYNVGVFALTKSASIILGQKLEALIKKLYDNPSYNPHDEQLPINSIMHLKKIPAASIDPIFNYTKSRMKKNIGNGTHDSIKHKIKIIHNRSCIDSEWIKKRAHEVNATVDSLINGPVSKVRENPRELAQYLYNKHIKKFRHDKPVVVFPDIFDSALANPLRVTLLKLMLDNPYIDVITPACLNGFDLPRYYSSQLGYRNDRGKICYIFIDDKVVLFDYFDFSNWTHSAGGRLFKKTTQEAIDGIIKFQYAPNNTKKLKVPVYPFVYPGPNDFINLPRYPVCPIESLRAQFKECVKDDAFEYSIFARWSSHRHREVFAKKAKDIALSSICYDPVPAYEYFNLMSRSRFAIAARGHGKWSHREMEICSLGVPLIAQKNDACMWRPFEAGKHYIEVTYENFIEVFNYYNEHYDEALSIASNGTKYFDENHSHKGCQKIFNEIVETVLGKRKWIQT